MAILSNINDKFAVDSTGAIQFNGQAGTSGYVLKSNGNAAPTWVDASTVIGGPYLPLSGGTLTGATATASGISFTVGGVLNGTSATFAGNITVGTGIIKPSIGGDIAITQGAIGLRINDAASAISPTTATSNNDNAVNLGVSNIRFKDLYLGGSITLGDSHFIGNQTTFDNFLLQSSAGENIVLSSAQDIYLTTGGTSAGAVGDTRLFIKSADGNVGIGVSSLQSWAKLQVAGTAGAQTGANQALYVTAPSTTAGEGVGIRLSAASGSNEAVGIIGMVNNASGNSGSMTFHTYNGGADIPERMRIDNSGNVGINASASLRFNSTVDNTHAVGYDSVIDGSFLRGQNGMRFLTGTGGGTERMRIRSDGYIQQGIAGTSTNAYYFFDTIDYGDSGIIFRDNTSTNSGYLTYNHGQDAMKFAAGGSERMRITSGGNVNVGVAESGSSSITGPFVVTHGSSRFMTASYEDSIVSINSKNNNNTLESLRLAGAYIVFYSGSGTTGSEKMRITSGGDVLIGGTSFVANSLKIDQNGLVSNSRSGTGTNSHYDFLNDNGVVGTIKTSGTSTSFNTSSDYRLKEDLQDFNGLDKVSKIPVYDFKWKTDESRSYGVMAHELQEVLPQAVNGEKDAEEMQGVDYSKLTPILLKAIQELEARVKELENK